MTTQHKYDFHKCKLPLSQNLKLLTVLSFDKNERKFTIQNNIDFSFQYSDTFETFLPQLLLHLKSILPLCKMFQRVCGIQME